MSWNLRSRSGTLTHANVGGRFVGVVAAIGVALSVYAAWRSWQSEADTFRSRYYAAADNRTSAVQHSAEELIARLQGIALGVGEAGVGNQDLGGLTSAFIPRAYKSGAMLLLNGAAGVLSEYCLTNCAGVPLDTRKDGVARALAAARRTGSPVAVPPMLAAKRNGKHTSWLAFAIPVAEGSVLLAVIDAMDMVEAGLAYLRPAGVDVYLFDETEKQSLAYFHRSRRSKTPLDGDPNIPAWTADHSSGSFTLAGRTWTVHNEPVRPIAEEIGYGPAYVLVTGLIFTIAVTYALAGQVRLRKLVEQQVARRTRRLDRINRDLAEEIEQRKRTERELEAACDKAMEASRLKSAFLANVSHEIRTPLNGISGFAHVLSDDPQLAAEHQEYVQTIVRCSSDLAALINDILDMSRIEAGIVELYPSMCDLRALLHLSCTSLQPLASAKGLDLLLHIEAGAPATIFVDEGRLKQVLRNLLVNAIKFTAQGHVAVSCSVVAGGYIRLEVADTGCGIELSATARLFDRFTQVDGSFQRVHGGLGLGLAIARELVEMMGGRIGVESQVGKGSRFWIVMPVQALETASGAVEAEAVLR